MWVLFFLASFAVGCCALRFFDSQRTLSGLPYLALGLMLGMTLVGYGVLIASLFTGSIALGAWIVLGALMGIGIWFRKRLAGAVVHIRRARERAEQMHWLAWGAIVIAVALFFMVSVQSMLWDKNGMPYAVLKGWGDGAYHLTMVERFMHARPFALEQPVLSGHALTYPFFVNFLTALLMALGMPLRFAWHAPTFVFGIGALCAAWCWARPCVNRKILSFAFLFVVFCGAGLGFLWLAKNIYADIGTLSVEGIIEKHLIDTPFEYSHLDVRTGGKPEGGKYPANITWVVPLISFFSHQRSFMLGAGMGFLIWCGLWGAARARDEHWPRWLLLIGLLPLMHLHTFLALGIGIGTWCLGKLFAMPQAEQTKVLWWAAGAFLVALPSVGWLGYGVVSDAQGASFFLRPWLGWTMCTHTQSWLWCDPGITDTTHNIVWFWLKNFGLTWLLWGAGLIGVALGMVRSRTARELALPSILLFALPNIFLFQPWEFDNNKILFWWWVLAALMGVVLLDEAFVRFRGHTRAVAIGCAVFFVGATASGVFDISQRARLGLAVYAGIEHFSYYDRFEESVGRMVGEYTLPGDILLTSHAPDNAAALIAGRRLYLGYPGWLWTQGKRAVLDERQRTIRKFLITGDPAPLCKDGVRYWLADDLFFEHYDVPVSQTVWDNTEMVRSLQEGKRKVELRTLLCNQ